MMRYAITILLFLFVQQEHGSAQERYGGSLRYFETEFPRTFDPITSIDDAANDRLSAMIFESLFKLNIHREIQRELAESYTVSGDNRSITVVLKEGIYWSNNEPATAFDVQRTIEAIRHAENTNIIPYIQDVRVHDDRTITFYFSRELPENVMLRILRFKILHRNQLNNLPLNVSSEVARDPVVSGYYRIAQTGRNLLRLHANEFYRNRPGESAGPYIDEIRMSVVSDWGTQVEYFQSGQVDVLINVHPRLLAQLRASGFQIRPYESLSFQFIAFNFRNTTLQNRDIRQAMVYGSGRQIALDNIFLSQGDLISGPFPPASSYYVSDTQPFPYNPFQAINLLESAGYSSVDSDGIRSNAEGERLEFDLVIPVYGADDAGIKVVAQFISDMRNIGIRINTIQMEYGMWIQRIRYEQDFDLTFAEVVFDETIHVSSFFYSQDNKPGGDNFISYNNPDVDTLIERFEQTTDHHEMININRRLHRILREDCPYIFLWSLKKNAAASTRVGNFMTRVSPYNFFDYVNEWYIREQH